MLNSSGTAFTRARRTFWFLAVVAVIAAGSLSSALRAPHGAITGLQVAGSGLLLIATTALATRVLVVIERARRRLERYGRDSN